MASRFGRSPRPLKKTKTKQNKKTTKTTKKQQTRFSNFIYLTLLQRFKEYWRLSSVVTYAISNLLEVFTVTNWHYALIAGCAVHTSLQAGIDRLCCSHQDTIHTFRRSHFFKRGGPLSLTEGRACTVIHLQYGCSNLQTSARHDSVFVSRFNHSQSFPNLPGQFIVVCRFGVFPFQSTRNTKFSFNVTINRFNSGKNKRVFYYQFC